MVGIRDGVAKVRRPHGYALNPMRLSASPKYQVTDAVESRPPTPCSPERRQLCGQPTRSAVMVYRVFVPEADPPLPHLVGDGYLENFSGLWQGLNSVRPVVGETRLSQLWRQNHCMSATE